MAWRYPPQYIGPKYPLDVTPINEGLSSLAGEVSGMLNEHNFTTETNDTSESRHLLSRDQLTEDAAFRLHYQTADPIPTQGDYTDKTNWVAITAVDGWQTFTDDGCQLEFVAVGGPTWLCASFSVACGKNTPSSFQKGYGYNFALELDGVIVYESLLGGGDSVAEFYNGPAGRAAKLNVNKTAHLVTPQGGGGVSAARISVAIDTIVNLPPGPHSMRIAIMNIRGRMQSGPNTKNTYLTMRELFAMELMR